MIWIRRHAVWLALTLCVLVVVVIALFLGGGMHGMYADDYVYKYFGSDLVKTDWTPNIQDVNYRVLAIWIAPLLARWLPDAELPIRLGLMAIHLLNVFLLGWLAQRSTGARWVGVVAGGAFLIPLFAYEPLLWFSAGVFYLFPLSLLLVGFHLLWSCRSVRQFYFVVGAVAAWVTMIFFIESGLLLPALTVPMALLMARRGVRVDPRAWMTALGVTYVVFFAYAFLVLRSSPIVAVHGKSTLDPVIILTQRVPEVFDSVSAYAMDWLPRGVFSDAFWLGTKIWTSSVVFWLLMIAFGAGFVFVARGVAQQWHAERASNALALLGVGAMWFVLALAPVLFIRGLSVSSRVWLFPSAGLALVAAGAAGWLMEKAGTRQTFVQIAAMVLLALFLLVNALSMAGLLRVYQLRWQRDQQQFHALQQALPQVPSARVWIFAHALDQTIAQPEFGRATRLDGLLYALFDTPWAIDRALWLAYRTEKIETIDKDAYGHSHVVGLQLGKTGEVKAIEFQGTIQIQAVPVTQLLAFTYRANGFEWLDPLLLTQPEKTYRVPLPLIEQMGAVPKRAAQIGIEPVR
jgi:hypothetical protein